METQFVGSAVAVTVSHAASPEGCESEEMLARVGQITRTLHDSLRELGLDKVLEKATTDIPDVRERLNYVARMTEQAAQRVLNATDAAIPMQERIDAGADACVTKPVQAEALASALHDLLQPGLAEGHAQAPAPH